MRWLVPTRELTYWAALSRTHAPLATALEPGWVLLGLVSAALVLVAFLTARIIHRSGFQRKLDEHFPGELAMLRAVLAGVPDLIYVKDRRGHFLLANQGTADFMGAGGGMDLVGKSDFDYYDSEAAAVFYQDEQSIMTSGQPLVSQDEHIEEPNGRMRHLLTTKVPLRNEQGEIIGIIGVGRDITAMKETEGELKRARENLHYRATHDSLTALLNREAILDMLDRELARSQRERAPISILLADLDHYKNVNDVHGHPVGDQVLREVARRCSGAVRGYDLVGRYGGEEFLLILGGCSATEARARADQLRQSIEASPIATACGAVTITISIGILSADDWAFPPVEDVLREVDVALYAAKAAGRNCCIVARPPSQS